MTIHFYSCPVTVAVRDAVYLSAADTVDKADADDAAKQPAIGIVVAKPSATQAIVLSDGEVAGFSGLTTGATQYLSTTPGVLTEIPPTAPGSMAQPIGFARNPTTLVINLAQGLATTEAFLSEEAEGSVVGTTEQVIDEYNVDFSTMAAMVSANFSGLIRVAAGTGTYHLQIGGTIGAADGTNRAELSTTSTGYVQDTDTGASFANPGGQQLVKITAVNDTSLQTSFIRGYHVKIG